MPRLSQDFDLYKDVIITQYRAETKLDDIIGYLLDHHNFKTSISTLKRRLHIWGECRNKSSTVDDKTLRLALITFYFYKRQASDKQILDMLNKKGLNTQLRFLRRPRLSVDMKRRRKNKDARFQDLEIMQILKEHLVMGTIGDYGLTHLYIYFRRNGFSISRNDLMYAIRLVDPAGRDRCYQKKQHRRRKFYVDGPNAVWFVDAHCKLEFFNIQIYAVIDAYS